MILDSNIVFSVEVSLTSQSTIWLYESCHFAFEAPLYVGMVYYENNFFEILKMHAHLGVVPIGTPTRLHVIRNPSRS